MIETPVRGLLEAHVVFRNCKVSVACNDAAVDLILLNFSGFDIILGRDLVENYRAIIDCENKVVTLCLPK